MKKIIGKVAPKHKGYHVASEYLKPVMPLIEKRMGLPGLKPGTLNVCIPEEYVVIPFAVITPKEYWNDETLKLQRWNHHEA